MPANETVQESPITLTDLMRTRFKGLLDASGSFLNRIGIAPNTVTVIGLIGHLAGAVFLARGQLRIGGFILLFLAPVDALDGAMARQRGASSKFGAFFDSVTDRYSEALIFGGLLAHYAQLLDVGMAMVVFAAAIGSLLVSYTRARAEGLGFEARIGILSRMERYLILVPSLILGFPKIGIALVAGMANLTALQRAVHIWRQTHGR